MVTSGLVRPISSQSTVSNRVLYSLVGALDRRGISRAEIVRTAQLPLDTLSTDELRVPRAQLYRLCEVALWLTRDRAFALHWSKQLAAGALDPISTLVTHCATLGDALSAIAQYHSLLCDDPGFAVYEQTRTFAVHCFPLEDAPEQVERLLAEVTLCSLMEMIRRFNPGAKPERVCFAYDMPIDRAAYTKAFFGFVHFNEPFTGMVLAREYLSSQSSVRDVGLYETLKTFVERRIEGKLEGVTLAMRVRQVLMRRGVMQRVEMRNVASFLGISERTLRRRLQQEHTSFEKELESVQYDTAEACLCSEHCSIAETSRRVGFAGTPAFHRAFKRWTGITPGKLRKLRANERKQVGS